ncbi:MAG: o-succinylbenzoate synthase [Actinomycetales bacterium]
MLLKRSDHQISVSSQSVREMDLASLRVIELPLRSNFRGVTKREIALFQGVNGWAEFSPFLEYSDLECKPWLESAIEAATTNFPIRRELIAVNGTIPETDNEQEIEELVAAYPGVKTFKIKVGSDLMSDLNRIKRVKNLAPAASIRIDVNGEWNVAEAIDHIKAIEEVTEIEYVEQPVANITEMRELKRKLTVKIAADEALRKSNDPLKVDLTGAADLLVLKVAPLGGIKKSLAIAAHHKLPVVVSSALESAIGITHGLRLAAALPEISYASGLATGSLFAEDLARHEIRDGAIRVAKPEIDEARLSRFAVPQERLEWWRERINRVLEASR